MDFINIATNLMILTSSARILYTSQICEQYTALDHTACRLLKEKLKIKNCNQTLTGVCALQHSYVKINIQPYVKALKGNHLLIFEERDRRLFSVCSPSASASCKYRSQVITPTLYLYNYSYNYIIVCYKVAMAISKRLVLRLCEKLSQQFERVEYLFLLALSQKLNGLFINILLKMTFLALYQFYHGFRKL